MRLKNGLPWACHVRGEEGARSFEAEEVRKSGFTFGVVLGALLEYDCHSS